MTVSVKGESEVVLTTQDAETDGDPTDSDTASSTADFSDVFSAVPAYGADGAGSTSWSYTLSLAGSDGDDSGLNSHGVDINLFNVGGTIVGSTAAVIGDVAAGNTIFSISVNNSGVVTLTQDQQVDHIEGGANDDFIGLTNGLVNLTGKATTTDYDGDTATHEQTIDLGGNIRFEDDEPVTVNDLDSLTVNEEGVGSTSGNVLTNDSMGADGPAPATVTSVTYNGVTTAVDPGGTAIQGAFGLLTIDTNGNYTYEYNAEPSQVPVTIGVGNLSGAVLSGFNAVSPFDGDNLNLAAIPDSSASVHGGAGANKQGFGVATGPGTLDFGEELLVQLSNPIVGSFTFQIGQYNKNQSELSDMTWGVYSEDGTLIESGTFADLNGEQTSNGIYTGAPISFAEPVSYIVFGMNDTTGQGYTVTNIEYVDDTYPTGLEDFTYTVTDGDGDTSSSHLYITSDQFIEGTDSANTLTGGTGDDILQGFDGADSLSGGLGNDILVGGDGEDTFIFSAKAGEGHDTILDFNVSEDRLSFFDLLDVEPDGDFDAADVLAFTDSVTVTIDGSDLVLTVPDQNGVNAATTITLAGVAADYPDIASGDSLSDLINSATGINVDTYAS